MTDRHYICDVIGTGTTNDPYRPTIADHGVNLSDEIATDQNGIPIMPWVIAIVKASDIEHAQMRADKSIDILPNVGIDTRLSSIAEINVFRGMLRKRGISTLVSDDKSMRDMIRALGRMHNPSFNEDNLRV